MTNLELALIPAIAALGGVALGIFGNGWLDRLRDRRAVQRERDQAIAELLAATADLVNSIQAARGIYGRSGWRPEIRLVAAVFASIGTAVAREKNLTPGMFLDWRRDAPLLERLLAIWRGQSDQQRTVALDLVGMLLPRATRFFAAVAVLTFGQDKELAAAVRDLAPSVSGLMDVVAARDREFARARSRAEEALGRFREIADQRRR